MGSKTRRVVLGLALALFLGGSRRASGEPRTGPRIDLRPAGDLLAHLHPGYTLAPRAGRGTDVPGSTVIDSLAGSRRIGRGLWLAAEVGPCGPSAKEFIGRTPDSPLGFIAKAWLALRFE